MYDIYAHNDRKYSIYKNNTQIGWWNKAAVSWFGGDKYKIIMDADGDINLLISFCLIIDNLTSDRSESIISFDSGNIGFKEKKFDDNWQPKD